MENQLQIIVRESKLEKSKAQYFLDNFQDYFNIASEWEKKAKMIKVIDTSQIDDMKMARTGRLILREKRIDVEKARKKLKEDYLRGGKLVDHIAGVLKELILPIEKYLDQQEHFVEIQEENKREALRLEVEKRMEEERIAKEKEDAEEKERLRIENEKLKKEAEEKERVRQRERKKHEAKLAKERAKAEAEKKEREKKFAEERAKAEAERKATEEKIRQERKAREKKLATERKKIEAKRKRAEEKARKEREAERAKAEAERKEKERLAEILKNQVECPKCGHKFQLKKEK